MKQDIVDTHNTLRRNFSKGANGGSAANMKKLIWRDDLARRARIHLRLSCKFPNLPFFAINDSDTCSNLARTSTGDIASDIQTWYSELIGNFYPPDPLYETFGVCWPQENCSHATVLLNADFRYVGCSFRRRCGGMGSLYCIYESDTELDTSGPWGQFYKDGAVCTKCSNDTSFCDDGLCNCQKNCSAPYTGHGELDPATCSCTCQYGMGPNCDEPCRDAALDSYEAYDICGEHIDAQSCENVPFVRASCAKTCGTCLTPIYHQQLKKHSVMQGSGYVTPHVYVIKYRYTGDNPNSFNRY
ncbi:scoloptoxin SSD976-like [Mya arenaria]|uniref:scoloptoxin SSD976-like n=1 Tax=Mya arenaria TaxID=6604 RepID=UPI0022DF09C9|nr:scoloptoxin SSD976-like [Mya arenaria]